MKDYDKFMACTGYDDPEQRKLFELIWNKVSPEYKIIMIECGTHDTWDYAYGDGCIYLLPEADWNHIFLEGNGVNPLYDEDDRWDEEYGDFITFLEDGNPQVYFTFGYTKDHKEGVSIQAYNDGNSGDVETMYDEPERFMDEDEWGDEDYKIFPIEEAADIITELLLK